ncbi:hypothetical protein [Streptomyces chryseus]
MREFRGDATVVLADGTEYLCQASLKAVTEHETATSFTGSEQVKGKTDWFGTISLGGQDAAFAVENDEDRQLRIQRTSRFITNGGDMATGVLDISGSGDVPFD